LLDRFADQVKDNPIKKNIRFIQTMKKQSIPKMTYRNVQLYEDQVVLVVFSLNENHHILMNVCNLVLMEQVHVVI